MYRDVIFFFLPLKEFLAEHLRHGELPLWNPGLYLGTPFLASLQTGVLYPPSALLVFPFPLGLNLFLIAHYAIAFGGSWLWLRGRGLDPYATVVGALTFAIGGYLVSALNVMNHLQSAAWTPWVLWAADQTFDRWTFRRITVLAMALALLLLGGAPEIVLLTGLCLFVVSIRPDVRKTAVALGGVAVAGLFAALLSAYQLGPTIELVQRSSRGGAMDFAEVSYWSIQPVSLLQLVVPHSASLLSEAERGTRGTTFEAVAPWLTSFYLGVVALCLCAAGAVRAKDRWQWLTLVAIGLVLGLGAHTPLLRLLYDSLPGLFGRFRYPEKFWFLVHLAASVLAAEGLGAISSRDRRPTIAAVVAAASLVLVASAVWIFYLVAPIELVRVVAFLRGLDGASFLRAGSLATDVLFKAERLALVLGGFLFLLALFRGRRLSLPVFGIAVTLLCGGDLAGAHRNLNLSIPWTSLVEAPMIVDPAELRATRLRVFPAQTSLALPPGQPRKDVAGFDELRGHFTRTDSLELASLERWRVYTANGPMFHDVGSLFGAEAIVPRSGKLLRDVLVALPREKAIDLVRLLSVGYLITRDELGEYAALELAATDGAYRSYRIREPVKAAYLADRLLTGNDEIAAFNQMIAPGFRPGRDAVVHTLPEGWVAAANEGPPGEVSIDGDHPNSVELSVRSIRPTLLVLNDAFDPHWTATVDGQPAPVLQTNGIVRGVIVPAGRHSVVFRYMPRAFSVGSWISMAACLLVLSAWIRPRRTASPVDG